MEELELFREWQPQTPRDSGRCNAGQEHTPMAGSLYPSIAHSNLLDIDPTATDAAFYTAFACPECALPPGMCLHGGVGL